MDHYNKIAVGLEKNLGGTDPLGVLVEQFIDAADCVAPVSRITKTASFWDKNIDNNEGNGLNIV